GRCVPKEDLGNEGNEGNEGKVGRHTPAPDAPSLLVSSLVLIRVNPCTQSVYAVRGLFLQTWLPAAPGPAVGGGRRGGGGGGGGAWVASPGAPSRTIRRTCALL